MATQHPELMTQDRDLNLVLEPRTQPPAEHINQSTDQGIEEPQEHGPQPAPTGHGRLKTPFTLLERPAERHNRSIRAINTNNDPIRLTLLRSTHRRTGGKSSPHLHLIVLRSGMQVDW
jgi:hypothetical protein